MPFRQASDRAGDGRGGSEGDVPRAPEGWPLNVRWITPEELAEMYPDPSKPPAPDNTVTISADFYLMACNLGKRK